MSSEDHKKYKLARRLISLVVIEYCVVLLKKDNVWFKIPLNRLLLKFIYLHQNNDNYIEQMSQYISIPESCKKSHMYIIFI